MGLEFKRNKIFLTVTVGIFSILCVLFLSCLFVNIKFSEKYGNKLSQARELLKDEHSKQSFDLMVEIIDDCYDFTLFQCKRDSRECFLKYNDKFSKLSIGELSEDKKEKEGDTIIIGGINSETYAVEEKRPKRIGKNGRAIFFEPDPVEAQRAAEYFNKYGNMFIYPVGLWKTNTSMKLWKTDISTESSVKKEQSFTTSFKKRNEYISANFVTLDDFVKEKNINKIDYIRLNIEGSELEALTGAQNTIKKFKPRLLISLDHNPVDLFSIILYLNSHDLGYKYELYLLFDMFSYCLYATID